MGNLSRGVLAALLGAALVVGCSPTEQAPATTPAKITTIEVQPADSAPLKAVEQQYGVRLGMYAINVHTGQTLSYREGERFGILSSFKGYLAAAMLHEHPISSGYLDKVITYTEADVVPNSPEASKHAGTGMTIAALCEAAVTLGDNTAANLLLNDLGGPSAVTAFAREIGDVETRLDNVEPNLNTDVPGDDRDTTTPTAIANGYRALVLGDALAAPERDRLKAWLLASKTGDKRIRAGLPANWTTADKTGSGDHGSANDIAVTWSPDRTPFVIAVLTNKPGQDADYDEAALAAAAKVAAESLTR